jgi:pimeloyl-ACP methyl ester carboxylesterase
VSLGSILALAGVATAAVAALVIGLSWLIARLWCAPKRRAPSRAPSDFGLSCEPISFSSGGVAVRGWFIGSAFESGPAATIVLAHGWSGNAADMLPAARALHDAGFAVALYDARGHGTSGKDGPITIRKFAEDIRACLDHLGTRSDIDPARVGLLGHSLGGAGAILAAAADARLRAVVSCSAFTDPRTISEDFLRRLHVPVWPFLWLMCRFIEHWLGMTMDEASPQRWIGQIKVPVLLLHGEHDRFIPSAHMKALYAAADRDRARMRSLPNRRHADVTTDVTCGEEIVAFFGKNLTPRRARNVESAPRWSAQTTGSVEANPAFL